METTQILENVLRITIREDAVDATSDPPTVYLEGLAKELAHENQGSGEQARLNLETVERALMARLTSPPQMYPQWPIHYLIGCHRRSLEAQKTVSGRMGGDSAVMEALVLVQQLAVSYVGFILHLGMFPQPQEAESRSALQIVDALLMSTVSSMGGSAESLIPSDIRSLTKFEVMAPSFMDEFLERFVDEGIEESIQIIGSGMTEMLSQLSILGEFNDLLNLLENLMSRKNFASVICSTESFLPENRDSMCGRDIEDKTLLGAAFGISAIPDIIENPMMPSRGRAPDVADRCFPGADSDRPADIQSSSSMIQVSLNQLQSGLHRIIMVLLKNNETKSKILDWIAVALNANRERTKMRPDMKKASTDGFMINMCSVLLRLCRPFLDASNGKAWSKLDVKYASDPRARGHCFEDDTRLGLATDALATWVTDEISSNEQPSYHFICECFFLTANALRLGIFKALDNCQQLVRAAREYDREAAHMPADTFSSMRTSSLKRVSSRLKSMAMCLEASLQQEDFLIDFISFYALIASYLPKLAFSNTEVKDGVHSLPLPSPAPKAFLSLPEYYVENLCTALTWIGRFRSQLLTSNLVEQFMLFFALFLGNNDYVKNPYLRGKMVESLSSYMPQDEGMDDAHPWDVRRARTPRASQEVAAMVDAHPLVVENLIKALVLLFVEIERTDRNNAFYEKFSTRYQIGEVMVYLWDHPGHRAAWRRVAEEDPKLYIRFINMMINDSQYLLQEALDTLPEVRTIEMEMADEQTWHSLPDAAREERSQNLESHRRHLLSDFGLASIYLKLMKITSDDPQIAARFFNVQVRDRQARILDFFLRYLTLPNERKRLKLKNPEKYGWKPRELISSLALIHAKLYQANREEWSQAVAADTDYYGINPDIFDHLVSILTSLGTDATIISSIESLKEDAAAAVKASTLDEENFDEVPEEFEDPLSYRLMKDPVRIPSGTILDRSTILQHLLTDNRDPFSREPMTEDDLVEESELKDRIHAWLAEQRKKSINPQDDNMEQ